MWKRWLMILGCLGLVAARRIWPQFQVDPLTVWLVGIAAVLFALPEVRSALPYIKSVKVGEAEVQLRAQVAQLGTEIDDAQAAIAEAHPQRRIKYNASVIEHLFDQACIDPRAALLRLSTNLEAAVQHRLQEAGLPEGHSYTRLPQAVEAGVKAGLFPAALLPACQQFWRLRNHVVHQGALHAEPGTILALVSLGTELFKLLTIEQPLAKPAAGSEAHAGRLSGVS
jgi:hypothetical protein